MTDTIPDWAGKRACELLNDGLKTPAWTWPEDRGNHSLSVVAKLVMQHETKPVDPDEELVAKVINAWLADSCGAENFNARSHPESLARAVSQYKQEKGSD